MAYNAGQTMVVTAGAVDQVTKLPISAPACNINFYAPPKNPKFFPSDRVVDYTVQAVFDNVQHLYVAYVDTSGWLGGLWWYQSVLSYNGFTASEYSNVTIIA
jgi:hypothetical protein